jgi:dTDP-4-dehydrorhamnose 3,5-epimerase
MESEELEIPGVFIFKNFSFHDSRGYLREWFQEWKLNNSLDEKFIGKQANLSVSKKNVVRGLHYSITSEGQAKLITCINGRIMDYVVDLRTTSPTFMKSLKIELSPENGVSLYVPRGFGHGFKSMKNNSIVTYLLSSPFNPEKENVISIFDPQLKILVKSRRYLMSDKDLNAPSLAEQIENKLLPKLNFGPIDKK